MGSGSKIEAPKQKSAGKQLQEWLTQYRASEGEIRDIANSDEATRLMLAQKYSPEYTKLGLSEADAYTRGMLELQKNLAPSLNAQAEADAGRALMSAGRLAPQYDELTQGKEAVAIRKLLGEQVLGELSAGASLDPEAAREVEQAVRLAQVSRGVTHGNAAAFQEAMTKGSAGQRLRQSRQSAAMSFLQNNAATRGDVLGWYQGRGGGSSAVMQGQVTQPGFAGNSQLMMPMIQANMGIDAQNQQLAFNAAQQNKANKAQMISSAVNMFMPYSGAGNAVAYAKS